MTEWPDVVSRLKAIEPKPETVFEMVSSKDMQGETVGAACTTADMEYEISYIPAIPHNQLLINDGYLYVVAYRGVEEDNLSWDFEYVKTIDEAIEFIVGY